jgi:uncharacterized protein YycO
MPLQVLLFRGSGIVQRLIAWQTRGPYCHAALLLPDGQQIEAWTDGVDIRPAYEPHGCYVDRFTVAATDAQVESITKFAEGEIGCPYDWEADFCFVTRMHPSSASETKWFCSELAYASLQAGGINLFRDTQAFEVSPSLLGRSPLLSPFTP